MCSRRELVVGATPAGASAVVPRSCLGELSAMDHEVW